MASSFDGLGMGYLGSERSRFKGPNEPSLGKGLLGIGLYKAGVIDSIDDAFSPEGAITSKIKSYFTPDPNAGVINDGTKGYKPSDYYEAGPGYGPNENAAAMLPASPPVAPQPVAPVMQTAPVATPVTPQGIVQPVDERQIDEVIGGLSNSFVTPNALAQRDASADVGVLQIASAPPPPPPMNMNQQQGGGGGIMQAIAPEILKLFLA